MEEAKRIIQANLLELAQQQGVRAEQRGPARLVVLQAGGRPTGEADRGRQDRGLLDWASGGCPLLFFSFPVLGQVI